MAIQVQKHSLTSAGTVLLAALLLVGPPALAGKLYKWTDEQGGVHYSDKLPADAVEKAHETLNRSGLTTDEVDRAKTDDEIMQEKMQQDLELQARRQSAEEEARQRRRDQILLDTFTTAQDLLITRDDRLNAIDSMINLTKANNKRIAELLDTAKARAAQLEKAGREVPENDRKTIGSLETQFNKNEEFLRAKAQERIELEKRFAEDLERFHELKSGVPAGSISTSGPETKPIAVDEKPDLQQAPPQSVSTKSQ